MPARRISLKFLLLVALTGVFVSSSASIALFVPNVSAVEAVYWTGTSMLNYAPNLGEAFYRNNVVMAFTFINSFAYLLIVSFIVASFVDMLSGFNMGGRRMLKKIGGMKDHFVVCGYGKVGEKVCDLLEENGLGYVVIEKRKEVADWLREREIPVIEGDAVNPKVLEKAGITKARGLVASVSNDADNVFIVLTAKEMNPKLILGARAHSEAVVSKLHHAGAEIVVLPEIVGGLELGREILKLGSTYMEKLVSKGG